jgi:hypothetical protein
MPDLAEMRAELKLMRQEHPDFKPVSKMKKADISSLLEKMKQSVEITPAIALTKDEPTKPAKGEVLKVKAVSESKVAPMKMKAEPKMKEKKEEKPVEEAKKKETMAERMARIRAMRGKKD